jgi:hypothetical protein
MDKEWLESPVEFSFSLNNLSISDDYTREEAITLLALFELSGGTSEVGIEGDRIQGKVDSYIERLKENDLTLEELVDSVKRKVHPTN